MRNCVSPIVVSIHFNEIKAKEKKHYFSMLQMKNPMENKMKKETQQQQQEQHAYTLHTMRKVNLELIIIINEFPFIKTFAT